VNLKRICEYDGVGWNKERGKFREWKGYLENSDEESVLLIKDNIRKIVSVNSSTLTSIMAKSLPMAMTGKATASGEPIASIRWYNHRWRKGNK
jgi:hypothetical protein